MVRILIVDDSEELLLMFTHFLSMKGYTVATSLSHENLINKICNFAPDIILLDVKLKDADGRKVCHYIKETISTKSIPVVLMSANPELLKHYDEYYAIDVIEKPFDIASVQQKIERAATLYS